MVTEKLKINNKAQK